MTTCKTCRGTGEVICGECYGSGKSGIKDRPCNYCHGKKTQTCSDCNGSGKAK